VVVAGRTAVVQGGQAARAVRQCRDFLCRRLAREGWPSARSEGERPTAVGQGIRLARARCNELIAGAWSALVDLDICLPGERERDASPGLGRANSPSEPRSPGRHRTGDASAPRWAVSCPCRYAGFGDACGPAIARSRSLSAGFHHPRAGREVCSARPLPHPAVRAGVRGVGCSRSARIAWTRW